MMKKWPALNLCLLFILLLAACSTGQPTSSTKETLVPNEAPVSESETTPAEPSSSLPPIAENEAVPEQPAQEQEEASKPTIEEPKEMYLVNSKNFMIKPLDGESDKKIALLTFDDGPKGQVTTEILDILDKYHAKSIWFINGFNYGWDYQPSPEKADTFTSLVKEIHSRGHLVANHTWEHENLRKLSPEKQRQEILSMNELIFSITGEKPKYFRPPFGAYSDVQKQVMKEENMQWMNWSVGSLDWELKDPNQVVEQVISNMHNGGNILMHDFPVTAEALDPMLKKLTEMGYEFVLPTEVIVE